MIFRHVQRSCSGLRTCLCTSSAICIGEEHARLVPTQTMSSPALVKVTRLSGTDSK